MGTAKYFTSFGRGALCVWRAPGQPKFHQSPLRLARVSNLFLAPRSSLGALTPLRAMARPDLPDGAVCFAQREDLTTRLRNILDDYPAGTGPFKESQDPGGEGLPPRRGAYSRMIGSFSIYVCVRAAGGRQRPAKDGADGIRHPQ